MSRAWAFFDTETGEFIDLTYSGSERHLRRNTPAGCEPVAGTFDRLAQRIDVVALRAAMNDEQPSAFVVAHEDAAQRKQTVLDTDRDRAARAALREIDLRSVRRLRSLSNDAELLALEREAAEIRNDLSPTPIEIERADRMRQP